MITSRCLPHSSVRTSSHTLKDGDLKGVYLKGLKLPSWDLLEAGWH